jgi:hypothetical protein
MVLIRIWINGFNISGSLKLEKSQQILLGGRYLGTPNAFVLQDAPQCVLILLELKLCTQILFPLELKPCCCLILLLSPRHLFTHRLYFSI